MVMLCCLFYNIPVAVQKFCQSWNHLLEILGVLHDLFLVVISSDVLWIFTWVLWRWKASHVAKCEKSRAWRTTAIWHGQTKYRAAWDPRVILYCPYTDFVQAVECGPAQREGSGLTCIQFDFVTHGLRVMVPDKPIFSVPVLWCLIDTVEPLCKNVV